MQNRVECCVCEGTGRERIENERTMICHNGCDNGFFEATAADLDGKRARHRHALGYLFILHGALCLQTELDDLIVYNLDPLTVEILP